MKYACILLQALLLCVNLISTAFCLSRWERKGEWHVVLVSFFFTDGYSLRRNGRRFSEGDSNRID